MRLFSTLLVIILATTQLMAEPLVESCPSDTSSNSQQNTVTLSHQQSQTTLSVYIIDNEIHFSEVPDGSMVCIYSITGARIASYIVHDNKVVMSSSLAKGIYIIRTNNRAAKITVR